MCVVIDACCFSMVFNKKNLRRDEFQPIYNWIVKGKGMMVYGGSKYRKEMRKVPSLRRVFIELLNTRKMKLIDDIKVDHEEKKLKQKFGKLPFNDFHLVAIVIVSKCRIICSINSSDFKYMKGAKQHRGLYQNSSLRPKIYSKKSNRNLLCKENLKPCI